MVRAGNKCNFIQMRYKIVRNLLCSPKTFGHIDEGFFAFSNSKTQLCLVPRALKSPA